MTTVPRWRKVTLVAAIALVLSSLALWQLLPRSVPGARASGQPLGMSSQEADERLNRLMAQYDWELAKENLKEIGRLVQIARRGRVTKPSSDWRTKEDTGLTSVSGVLAGGSERLRFVEGQYVFVPPGSNSQYFFIFDGLEIDHPPEEIAEILSGRGEDLPVLLDAAMYDVGSLRRTSMKTIKALVLRLNGEVSEVQYPIPTYLKKDDPIREAVYSL